MIKLIKRMIEMKRSDDFEICFYDLLWVLLIVCAGVGFVWFVQA